MSLFESINGIWKNLGETSQYIKLLTSLISGLMQVSVCINFLFDAKWRSTTWLSTFGNLDIFISIQQIYHLVNARRKVNIPIFTIWISCSPNVSNHWQGYNKSNSHFLTPTLLHPIRSFQEGVIIPWRYLGN